MSNISRRTASRASRRRKSQGVERCEPCDLNRAASIHSLYHEAIFAVALYRIRTLSHPLCGGTSDRGEFFMLRRIVLLTLLTAGAWLLGGATEAMAQQAFGRQWAHTYNTQDWNRFYHYPYVYYPQNYYGDEYYRSSESLYFRYPPEMRVPVYNKQWHNMYPEGATWNKWNHIYQGPPGGGKYHSGSHFILDTF